MIARVSFVGFALLLGLSRPSFATPFGPPPAACVPATLASYIALGSTGCTIDGEVGYFDFDFAVLASGGGAIPIGTSDILVTPSIVGGLRQLTFSSTRFSVAGAESVSYLMVYSVDPHPILFGFALDMDAFSPVAPGLASIAADLCVGAPFGGTLLAPTCGATPAALSVSHNGVTPNLLDSLAFGLAIADIGVRNTINLAANGASADFNGLTNTVVPEPAILWLLAVGVLAYFLLRRRGLLI